MFKIIQNALKTAEIRSKLLFTLLLIVIFRLGCYITVPGVDIIGLNSAMAEQNSFEGMVNIISGGAFSRFSIFAMSISPYITASIVIQLLGMVIPSLEKLTKEGGEIGRKKVNKYTKMLALLLSLVQAIGMYLTYQSTGIFIDSTLITALVVVLGLVTGTSILMWLGEQITSRGVGNGISMLIFVGIISGLPSGLVTIYDSIMGTGTFNTAGLMQALAIILGAIVLVAGVVFVQQAERRVPVQYSKKVVGRKMVGGQNTHIPLKLVMAGVMPVIFASSFMTAPAMIIQIFVNDIESRTGGFLSMLYNLSIATYSNEVAIGYTITNMLIYLILILGFAYFYTYATFNPAEVSSNIKRNGGFIPGIRPGKPTTDYIAGILSKITLFGGLFLAVIAILPMMLTFTSLNVAFGGTSILIVVGVALETVQQLESQLTMKHYKGFLE